MRIDDKNKVVWCSESEMKWYDSYEGESNKVNFMIYHISRIGFGKGLTNKDGFDLPLEIWKNIDKQSLVKAIIDDYTFKLEQPQKYYWRKKKEYLAWFEKIEGQFLKYSEISGLFLSFKNERYLHKSKFTETEARDLLKDDFDKFEKVECE